MAKARSPAYPVIGLKEAVDKVQMIYKEDYQNPIPRLVAARHMGYNGLNGKSLGVLSALQKYGLLEGRGDNTRVSDRAVMIFAHPKGSDERSAAIRQAAAEPDLFADLDKRSQGGPASDQALRAYLLTMKFIPPAADATIRAYRETQQFMGEELLENMDTPTYAKGTGMSPPPPQPPATAQGFAAAKAAQSERIVFAQEIDAQQSLRLLVSGPVTETVLDALADFVEFQRKLLQRVRAAQSREANPTAEVPSQVVPPKN